MTDIVEMFFRSDNLLQSAKVLTIMDWVKWWNGRSLISLFTLNCLISPCCKQTKILVDWVLTLDSPAWHSTLQLVTRLSSNHDSQNCLHTTSKQDHLPLQTLRIPCHFTFQIIPVQPGRPDDSDGPNQTMQTRRVADRHYTDKKTMAVDQSWKRQPHSSAEVNHVDAHAKRRNSEGAVWVKNKPKEETVRGQSEWKISQNIQYES